MDQINIIPNIRDVNYILPLNARENKFLFLFLYISFGTCIHAYGIIYHVNVMYICVKSIYKEIVKH